MLENMESTKDQDLRQTIRNEDGQPFIIESNERQLSSTSISGQFNENYYNFDPELMSQRSSIMVLDYIDETAEFSLNKDDRVSPKFAKANNMVQDIITSINDDGNDEKRGRSGQVPQTSHMSYHFKNRRVSQKPFMVKTLNFAADNTI